VAIACLRMPHLELRIALLDQPELDGMPLVLSNPESGRAVVIDATDEAAEKGVRPGMSLREATALCPDAVMIMPNPAMLSRISHQILTRLERLSPLVEADELEPGCWYVDLTGLDRHFPTTTAAARRMIECVNPLLRPRAGVATGSFAARIAAGIAAPGQVRSVPAGKEKAFLANAPVSWLPFPPEMTHQLRRLGLKTLGALTELPPAKLAARFGPDGRLAWELASGVDHRRISPRPREETVIEEMEMPTPVISREMLMVGLRQMVHRAFSRKELRGKQVRQVTLRAILENRRSWERTMVLKEPCGASGLINALDLRLQALELPGPVEAVALQLSGIVQEVSHQGMLPMLRPRHDEPLANAAQQLQQRYGLSPLFQVVEVEPWSRIPERRHALVTFEL
jgi:nucleotidyltransferase/DNA polymerase involved in DNA repair